MSNEFEFEEEGQPEVHNEVQLGTPEWEVMVMKEFLPDELYEGKYPTLNGLRRVSLKMFGKPTFNGPIESNSQLPVSSYCRYQVTYPDGSTVIATGDATQENTNSPFNTYVTVMAENRAEARVYRKALMLSIVSSEEIKGKAQDPEKTFESVLTTEYNTEDKMSDQQISIIKTKCKQLKIDYDKLLIDQGIDAEKATKADGVMLSKKITELQKTGIMPKNLK